MVTTTPPDSATRDVREGSAVPMLIAAGVVTARPSADVPTSTSHIFGRCGSCFGPLSTVGCVRCPPDYVTRVYGPGERR